MNANLKKVKIVFVVAILLIVVLFVISITQIIVINQKNKQKRIQQSQIEKLIKEKEYYKSLLNNSENLNPDQEFIVGDGE